MHRAFIEIEDDSSSSLMSALSPECSVEPDGSKTAMTVSGRVLKIEIVAEGLAPLRASVNSHLRWLHAAHDGVRRARKWKDGHIP